jgi:hypothetical protein
VLQAYNSRASRSHLHFAPIGSMLPCLKMTIGHSWLFYVLYGAVIMFCTRAWAFKCLSQGRNVERALSTTSSWLHRAPASALRGRFHFSSCAVVQLPVQHVTRVDEGVSMVVDCFWARFADCEHLISGVCVLAASHHKLWIELSQLQHSALCEVDATSKEPERSSV